MSEIKLGKELTENMLSLLSTAVLSEGGDGDALWYTRHFDVDDIYKSLQEYSGPKGWRIEVLVDAISWGTGEEWVVITNSEERFNSSPDWIQMKIQY
jgi:hypothetical protein